MYDSLTRFMTNYAIGDIQGCFDTFRALLEKISFKKGKDSLWIVGDIVNRGPKSLEVLRWMVKNQDHVKAVLGNHDLHLLACAAGERKLKEQDTLAPILEASDREALLDWLRTRPLLYSNDKWAMVHAGLHPKWSLKKATELAKEVEVELASSHWKESVADLYREKKQSWREKLTGAARLKALISVFMRVRVCSETGEIKDDFTGSADETPRGFYPWFRVPGRHEYSQTIVFGHWASLGLMVKKKYIALDSGCVWGNSLTAIRLKDRKVFQIKSLD